MSRTTPSEPQTDSGSLARDAMGVRDLVLTVLAALAPLTLIVAVAPLHFMKGGSAVPGGYLVAGAVMGLFAVGFMAMSRYIRNAGAFYATVTRGIGRPAGAAAATLALVAYNALQTSTYGALGLYAKDTVDRYFDIELPWWSYALFALVVVAWLGFRGVHTSARVLGVILLLEMLVLVILAGYVLAKGGPQGFTATSFDPGTVLRPENGAMFALVFGAFMGFESTAIFSEEARGGARTVRRATYISVAFIALFYAFITWIVVTAYGPSNIGDAADADPAGLVASLFDSYTSGPIADSMQILLLGSAFAALLALHNATNRYFYAMGRSALIPAVFSRTHPTRRSPWVAGLVQSGIALVVVGGCAVLGVDPYLGLLGAGSALGFVGIICLWALCCAAVIRYLRVNAPEVGLWRSAVAPGLGLLGLLTVLVLALRHFSVLSGMGTGTNVALLGVGVLGLVVGPVLALRLRRRDPGAYARLIEIGDDGPPPEGIDADGEPLSTDGTSAVTASRH